ncbi:sulfotransferase family 2 domain-containing protein [Prosthecomicrobium pneumaticum]|uniref:Sulfotransferase family protein n=1 Tax=Prosthecomicrobium pneumaticum TaxID=81895 RepID=A0A7W9FMR5_9HYPH|nr:sulfotransferase family 2 domain-containing protein [Prosthecomicrobium pneumaticum]MBB5753542.1 hypothetical protein [Prosthecomicrobium pneumaticum]
MAITREAVVWGYRFVLGREPESEAAIKWHRRAESVAALRRTLISSEEFRDLVPPGPDRAGGMIAAPLQPAVVFVHIPKCAGTTLHHALMAHYGAAACAERRNGLGNWPAAALAQHRFFSGHFDIASLVLIPGPAPSVVTLLRRPAERLVSLYRFLRSHTAMSIAPVAESMGLARLAWDHDPVSFFRHPELVRHPSINNAMVRQLSGPLPDRHWEAWHPARPLGPSPTDRDPERALRTAIDRLSDMTAFGLVERMERSIAHIFAALALPPPASVERLRETDRIAREEPLLAPAPPVARTPQLAEALAPHIDLDDRLYAAAAALFERRVGADAPASEPPARP